MVLDFTQLWQSCYKLHNRWSKALPFRSEQDLRGAVPSGGHVVSHHRIRLAFVSVLNKRTGQSEIGDLATTISVQEDVGRLQKYESFVEEATVFYLSKEEQRTGVNTFWSRCITFPEWRYLVARNSWYIIYCLCTSFRMLPRLITLCRSVSKIKQKDGSKY